MWEWLSTWGATPTIVLAVIAATGVFWKVARWTQRMEAGQQSLRELIDAQGTALRELIDSGLTSLRDEMRDRQAETRQTQAETRQTLDTLLLRAGGNEQTSARNSPRRLTPFGNEVKDHLDPDEWAAGTAQKLRPETVGLEPFEIDALCREHVRTRLDPEWQRRVARTAYECGSGKRAVEDVLHIVLRDALLAPAGAPPDDPPTA